MTNIRAYICSRCRSSVPGDAPAPRYACPTCKAETLEIDVDLSGADRDALGSDSSMWRYRSLLPVPPPTDDDGPLRKVGMTPLYSCTRTASRLGLEALYIKDDGALPTGSLKDRASAVVAMRARALGLKRLIAASTGNAGVAMAAMANAADLEAIVLVPKAAPLAKIAQLLVFGAKLLLVDGNYDDAFRLSREASQEFGWYCRNTAYNPFTIEGKKTAAFELCEQLGWDPPDRLYVSVGDGNIIAGVHKGLRELKSLGWIERMPKLVGVQAQGSSAVYNAFRAGADVVTAVVADTIADSIAADSPADGLRALAAAQTTGGHFVQVSDASIERAIIQLGRDASVFAEPAAATAYAGMLQDVASGAISPGERVAVVVTGNGLKDVAAASRAAPTAPTIAPTLQGLSAALKE